MEQFETHTSQDFNEPYNEVAQVREDVMERE